MCHLGFPLLLSPWCMCWGGARAALEEEEEELMGPDAQSPPNNHLHLAHSDVEVSAHVCAGPMSS